MDDKTHLRPAEDAGQQVRLIRTNLSWLDLALPASTETELDAIRHWLKQGEKLRQDSARLEKVRGGFASLFLGEPGIGKQAAACLIGTDYRRDVYRVDLGLIVSKYLGETEKNLSKIFDAAEHKNWILFFDEADALFDRRTGVDDAHDRYANQDISYLLQRIEAFDGVVILASNMGTKADATIIDRVQSVVHFDRSDGRRK